MVLIVPKHSLANEVTQKNLFSIENTYWSIVGNGPEAGDLYQFYEGNVGVAVLQTYVTQKLVCLL